MQVAVRRAPGVGSAAYSNRKLRACVGSLFRQGIDNPYRSPRILCAQLRGGRCGASVEEARGGAAPSLQVWEVEGRMRRRVGFDGVVEEEKGWEEVKPGRGSLHMESTGINALDKARSLFIPQNWPHSVTPDYLPYQLATLLAHITGWAEVSLATSSMLKAVGVGAGVAGATAATAGIKWIVKDGVGAVGRLFVGGGLARYFDEEPRKWRMLGELVNTVGVAMEIATSLYPQYFLILAGSGTLAKSVGKGMGKPAFRVIQQHFSISNNVGDVAAKEEVWEVAGQMLGLGATVIILKALEHNSSIPTLLGTWSVIAAAHIFFRYTSLRTLRFTGLNQKRACVLVKAHLSGQQLPDVDLVNVMEPMLAPRESISPRVQFGSELSAAVADAAVGGTHFSQLMAVYGEELYVLVWHEGSGRVALKEGAQGMDLLKALLQAAWLERQGIRTAAESALRDSLAAANSEFPQFCEKAASAGWNLKDIIIRTPDLRVVTGDLSTHET